MNEPQKIVIQDSDNHNEVIGIVTLVENTVEELEQAFKEYKDKEEDCWTWEGFIDYLIDNDWKFDFEDSNVHELEI